MSHRTYGGGGGYGHVSHRDDGRGGGGPPRGGYDDSRGSRGGNRDDRGRRYGGGHYDGHHGGNSRDQFRGGPPSRRGDDAGNSNGFDRSSYSRSRERERRRRKVQAECIRRAGGYQMLADAEGKEPVRLFWDGFQWVAKTGHSTALQNDPALMNSTRKMRRLYFGNLPLHLGLTETNFQQIVWEEMKKRAYCNTHDDNPVLCVWFAKDKGNYGFVEFASVEETERALMMDGMICLGMPLKVSRPNDYTTTSAQQNQAMALMGQHSAQLLQMQHQLPGAAPMIGPEALPTAMPPAAAEPSVYVRVEQMVSAADTEDADEVADVSADIREGFEPHGQIVNLKVVTARDQLPAGCTFTVGDVIVQFSEPAGANNCIAKMSNRRYEGRPITLSSLPESDYKDICNAVFNL